MKPITKTQITKMLVEGIKKTKFKRTKKNGGWKITVGHEYKQHICGKHQPTEALIIRNGDQAVAICLNCLAEELYNPINTNKEDDQTGLIKLFNTAPDGSLIANHTQVVNVK